MYCIYYLFLSGNNNTSNDMRENLNSIEALTAKLNCVELYARFNWTDFSSVFTCIIVSGTIIFSNIQYYKRNKTAQRIVNTTVWEPHIIRLEL